MSDSYGTGSVDPHTDSVAGSSTADAVKGEASQVTQTVKGAASGVASTAKEEAGSVVREVGTQVRDLVSQALRELSDQVGVHKGRVTDGLRTAGDDLDGMTQGRTSSGLASSLVSQASTRVSSAASWLETREPSDVLDEVRAFARRRPGTFIAAAAVAGVVVGRLTRSIVTNAKDHSDDHSSVATAGRATPPLTDTTSLGSSFDEPTIVTGYADPVSPTPVYSSLAGEEGTYVPETPSSTTEPRWENS